MARLVQAVVVMPSKAITLASVFVRESDLKGTCGEFFAERLVPKLSKPCGELHRVAVMPRDNGGEEIDVSDLNDPIDEYAGMELKKVTFFVDQPAPNPRAAPSTPLAAELRREPARSLPTWSHAGRTAPTRLFAQLRETMAGEGLGFSGGSSGSKVGCEWMLKLVKLLYDISTFHDKFKARGFTMPACFAFSKGANDIQKKGMKQLVLTQDVCEAVRCCSRSTPPLPMCASVILTLPFLPSCHRGARAPVRPLSHTVLVSACLSGSARGLDPLDGCVPG